MLCTRTESHSYWGLRSEDTADGAVGEMLRLEVGDLRRLLHPQASLC